VSRDVAGESDEGLLVDKKSDNNMVAVVMKRS
jgi:hypothetical protein